MNTDLRWSFHCHCNPWTWIQQLKAPQRSRVRCPCGRRQRHFHERLQSWEVWENVAAPGGQQFILCSESLDVCTQAASRHGNCRRVNAVHHIFLKPARRCILSVSPHQLGRVVIANRRRKLSVADRLEAATVRSQQAWLVQPSGSHIRISIAHLFYSIHWSSRNLIQFNSILFVQR